VLPTVRWSAVARSKSHTHNARVRALAGILIGLAAGSSACRPAQPPAAGRAATRPNPPSATLEPRFLARLEFPTANGARAKPTGLLAADLDGDGKDELVAATRSPGGVEIWSALTPVLGPAPEPRAFAFGDFPVGPVWIDRGKRVAAIASRETLELAAVDLSAAMRSKPGDPLPVAWRATLPARPRAIAGGAGGRVGVITVADELLVYSGPQDPKRIALAGEHAVCALLASDGQRIAIGYQASRKLALLGADGAVLKSVELPGLPRALAEADLDGDGDPELAVAAGDDRALVFGLGRKGGSSAWLDGPPLETQVGAVPIALASAQRRGAAAALAVLALHDQEVRILDLAGGSAAALASRAAGQHPVDLAVGDFDGDGALDLAVANPDSRRVGLFFGAGAAKRSGPCFDSETRVPCDRAPSSIAAGDVDGDGLADVAVLAAADETVTVMKSTGGELAPIAPAIPAPGAVVIAVGPLRSEKGEDVAWVRWTSAGPTLAATRGAGLDLHEFPIPGGGGGTDLVLARLGEASRPTALVADPEKGFVHTISASGEVHPTPVPSGPRAIALLGSPDRVAVATGGPGPHRGIHVARSVKSGELVELTSLEMTQYPIALCAADLDGDGLDDLAVLALESPGDARGVVVPWIAQKDGTWRELAPMPTGLQPHKIAAGDLDGDGKADLLVTAQGSHHVEVWLARAGDPVSFVRAPDLAAGTGPLDILLADLDGDGKKEIVVANGFSDDLSVIRVR
jgi:hypothetical protein